MKKLMIILCTILCANILAAQTQFTSGGLKYEVIDNNSVKVARQNSSDISGSVVIPSTVTYIGTTYNVTSIGDSAFYGCRGLTSVTIPNSVTSIGESAFRNCSGLPSVTIPNSVTSIGEVAFYDCIGLTSVTIGNSVTSIGGGAFSWCSGLTSINVASGNTHYSSIDGVLYNYVQDTLILCPEAKTSVTIPNSVTSIGNSAFWGCSGLTSVTIPNGVTSIGNSAFGGCSGLTSVSIPNSLTSIGYSAFSRCSGLTSVTLPNSLTSIGDYAFGDCSGLTTLNFNAINCQDFSSYYSDNPFNGTSLTTVNIGDSVQRIPAYFVSNRSRLTSVTIPNSVTSIGDYAFYYCRGLTSVTIPTGVTSIGDEAFSGCSGLTSVTIPTGVTSIGDSAFYNCSGLTSVTIPNSVTSIGGSAFNGCSGLTSVTIPNSVTSIGGSAFNGCSGLTSVTIGDRVTSIENSVFRGCTSLDSITIGTGVAYIEQRAFNDCSRLTTLNFNAINCQDFSSDYYYTNFSNTLTTVNIGDSVQRIPANFVIGCWRLTSVTIGNSVTSIGDSAFYYCSSLTSITIPTGVTSIGGSAFEDCSGLTLVTIPTGVTSIGEYAFNGCSGLTSVSIPNSVTSIGEYAFSGCSSLTSVTIPTGVTSIGNGAFSGCSGLTSVTIPNSVTSIGGSAFSRCSGLTSVTLPNSLTSISNAAFSGCSGLTSITLPNSVTSIGDRAFYECLNLSSLISLATVPPTIGNEAFPYPNICTVTVPCGSLAAYTASTCYWSVYFPQRITTGFPFELNASANDSTLGTVAITTGESCAEGVLTAIPELCYRFVAWNDGNTTNPRTITLTQDTTLTANFERAVYTQEIHHAICEGSVYTENGFNVSEPGTYTQNLQTVNGCDSIVTLTLTVNPVESTNLTAAICEGSVYTENGFNVSEAGTYTQNLQTVNGCDSIVTLNLTVNPTYNITIDASINEGETYEENGFSESEAGTYVHTLQAVNGCDSVITLNLTVNSSLTDVVANAIEVSLYPNPANAYTMLKVEGLKEQTPVYLFDIQGRKLKEYIMNIGQETLRIDLGDLPKGVYTIMLGNTTKKLIVK